MNEGCGIRSGMADGCGIRSGMDQWLWDQEWHGWVAVASGVA